MKYDYLIVGSGLSGAVFAHEAMRRGKKCIVIEKRGHVGGNIYCEATDGVTVHKYGAHIFHTSDKRVWDYVNSLAQFAQYTHSPIANYKGEIYNLPFNLLDNKEYDDEYNRFLDAHHRNHQDSKEQTDECSDKRN